MLIGLYTSVRHPAMDDRSRLHVVTAAASAIDVITDLRLWLRAHGCDSDDALDRAQMHIEEEPAC